jgi:hypothetical protein
MSFFNSRALPLALAVIAIGGPWAAAQGCVAAHSNQRSFDELITGGGAEASPGGTHNWIHNLTVDIGYRVFNSNKYFQGSTEIPRPNAVRNHQNIFDVAFEYQLSHRWSIIGDVPVFNGSRNQVYPPTGIFRVSGVGDITVGLESWLFRPPTEHGGNIAVNAQLKIPTGKDNATGAALLKGQTVIATADPSLQPGDGTWAFSVGSQAYQALWHTATAYAQGNYLASPADTNGVNSFRSQPGQGVLSATDQYLYRAGIVQMVPKVRALRGLAVSAGIRGEGVPVHDLIGASDGFRRPGFIFSFDPGLMFNYKRDTLSVNGPWAIYRDRPPSVPEIQYNITNGDAFFSDYTVIASISHHF